MGKRSNYERNELDYYPTPYEACVPLFPLLKPGTSFIEPCAGDGRLIRHIESVGLKCVYACDIEPRAEGIDQRDVLFFNQRLPPSDLIITNPPWERTALHKMIELFSEQADTWLLFDADWMHTAQAAPFSGLCKKIVSVGRVKWIEDSSASGMENAAWYMFSKNGKPGTEFYFR